MMNLKMLYLGCHAILEYNEISLFNEIGIDVFCLGSYFDPMNPIDPKRPPIEMESKPDLIKLSCPRDALTKELVDNFDIIYIMHIPDWLEKNWNIIKDKIVIWRSIGQSIQDVENRIRPFRRNIKIVRYSPFESNIPGYVGEDAIIRFHLDPDEFNNWNGNINKIITVSQDMRKRIVACSYDVFEQSTRGLPRIIYGPGNDNTGDLNGGILSYDDLKKALRDNRVYFYTGTHPSCYTLNFIEAWMTGIPIVAIGGKYGNASYFNQVTYEVPSMIRNIYGSINSKVLSTENVNNLNSDNLNGFNMFVSDDINMLHYYCKKLLEDESLAKDIGKLGRKSAIQYFGKKNIKPQWEEFFRQI